MNAYCISWKLKKAQVFAVFMRDLKYQAEKEAKPKTDLKNIVQNEYHYLFDVFFKKNSDILFLYQKYNYKIILEKKQKHSHTPFYKILL